MPDATTPPLIVVVDDSPSFRLAHTRILLDAGYAVLALTSAHELLATVARVRPAVVLLDVVMPGINGFEAARMLHADPRTQSVPIIFATSRDAPSDRVWGARQGAVAHLAKPLDSTLLLAAVVRWAPRPA